MATGGEFMAMIAAHSTGVLVAEAGFHEPAIARTQSVR